MPKWTPQSHSAWGRLLRLAARHARTACATMKHLHRLQIQSPRCPGGHAQPSEHRGRARAMANFGFSILRVVNPYDVAFREARSAVGPPRCCARPKSSPRSPPPSPIAPGGGHHLRGPSRVAPPHPPLEYGGRLILPRAAQGARRPLVRLREIRPLERRPHHCHWLMRIPTADADLSMNSPAVALCLYELARNPKPSRLAPIGSAASAAEYRADHRHAHRSDWRVRLRQPRDRRFHGGKVRRMVPAQHRCARRPVLLACAANPLESGC